MLKKTKDNNPFSTLPGICVLGTIALFSLFQAHSRALAQELDPFQTTTRAWTSFDHYKEEQRDKVLAHIRGEPEKDESADEANAALPEINPAIAVPVLAPPERPLMPPVMPGVNKGFDVRIDTTDDDTMPTAHIANMDQQPDLQLSKTDWLDAKQAALSGSHFNDATPINFHISPLPSLKVPVSLKPEPIVAVAAVRPPVIEQPPPPKLAASKLDPAACAAIDAYKKRQLQAIQSDRQTLMALQAAIAELGLQKKLDFMANGDSKINTPDNGFLSDAVVTSPSPSSSSSTPSIPAPATSAKP